MSTISVVIPTFERPESLRRCLDALERQTAPRERFEVIVVDDAPSDATAEVVRARGSAMRLRYLPQRHGGAGAARNRGVEAAEGEWCLFVDDDIIVSPRLVEEHLAGQEAGGGVVALGPIELRLRKRRSGLAAHLGRWWDEHYRQLDAGEASPGFWDCFTGNLSVPTASLREIGGFDEALPRAEDVELGYRLVRSGLEIVYLPEATAEQHHQKGFGGIARDYDRAGAAAVAMWRRHPELAGHPPLGDFAQGGTRVMLLRRAMLATRAPIWPLALLDPFLARRPSTRIYAFLQLYCFWRGLRRELADRDTWRRLTRGPVILMYHAVAGPGEKPSRYIVSERRLRRHLAWLRLRRRPVLGLDDYLGYRDRHELPPARSVLITFDDGYAETATAAWPMVRRAGFPMAVFVVTGAAGRANMWDGSGPLAGRPTLAWDELRRLAAEGVTIGAHTASHADLTALAAREVAGELEGSRRHLEREVGEPSRHFAYPYGALDDAVVQAVGDAGFAGAYSVEPGANGPAVPHTRLRRLEVWGTRSMPRFALDLWLGRHLGTPVERVSAETA